MGSIIRTVEWLLYSNQKVNFRLLLECNEEGITT
jgi:hypothetical protein